tara:strand:- start:1664 stop:2080 length:417 start_codon:yes stop_codon:yes gene_type:complete
MKSPFAPVSHEEFMEGLYAKAQRHIEDIADEREANGYINNEYEFNTREYFLTHPKGIGKRLFDVFVEKHSKVYEKKEKKKAQEAKKINKLLHLEFLNKCKLRMNYSNITRTSLFMSYEELLRHCISECEKELRKEEIE